MQERKQIMKSSDQIHITERDLNRLERLLRVTKVTPNVEALEDELGRAVVVAPEKISPDVVTMNSKARFVDEATGEQSDVTLVYPQDADAARNRISILAPVGSALLGLSVGDSIEWPLPSGRTRRLRIIAVLYQPEAEGRFDL
jgi:regulator of nucleoside diphosphate kinase